MSMQPMTLEKIVIPSEVSVANKTRNPHVTSEGIPRFARNDRIMPLITKVGITYNYPNYQLTSGEIGPPIHDRLLNGASGYFQNAGNRQQSSLTILLPLGTKFSAARSMLADILFLGSESMKSFVTQCSSQGIDLSLQPVGEKVQLNVTAPTGREAEMIQAALAVLTRPVADRPTFNKLKEDCITEFRNMDSLPTVPLEEAVRKEFYGPNHPYSKSRNDIIRELAPQTLESILSVYYQALKSTGQAEVYMVSPQSVQLQQLLLNQGIQQAGWFMNPYNQPLSSQPPPVSLNRGSRRPLLIPNEKLHRANIFQVWRAPSVGDPDYPAFCILFELLNGMSGAFFKTLRTEKGLVYSTKQSYNNKPGNGSAYSVNAEVDYDKIIPALQGMNQVIQSMIKNPASSENLREAKKQYSLNLNDAMQSSEGIASLGEPWLQNGFSPEHPQSLRNAIEQVTTADIQRVANKIFNPANGFQVTGISAPSSVLAKLSPKKI